MQQMKDFGDVRARGVCVYCGEVPDSRDHVPSKVLLDDPLPENLHVVEACTSCNNSFSLDEQYVAALLECILRGGTENHVLKRVKVRNILDKNHVLRARLEKAKRSDDSETCFEIEYSRVENVVMKLARGHAAYESGSPRLDKPIACSIAPLPLLSDEHISQFELITPSAVWPEIGTRAFARAVMREGWVIVQPDVYRFTVVTGAITTVRLLIHEYLAAEVIWDHRDLSAVDSFARTLVQTENAQPDEIIGCDNSEIEHLEELCSIKLPFIYKQFLRKMGTCAGYWEDTDSLWCIDELSEANARARYFLQEAIEENRTDFSLTENHFVFLLGIDTDEDKKSGPYILFFEIDAGDDPPVHYFRFSDAPEQIAQSFSEWLREQDEMLQEIDSLW